MMTIFLIHESNLIEKTVLTAHHATWIITILHVLFESSAEKGPSGLLAPNTKRTSAIMDETSVGLTSKYLGILF